LLERGQTPRQAIEPVKDAVVGGPWVTFPAAVEGPDELGTKLAAGIELGGRGAQPLHAVAGLLQQRSPLGADVGGERVFGCLVGRPGFIGEWAHHHCPACVKDHGAYRPVASPT
jgi:hypothetical protein